MSSASVHNAAVISMASGAFVAPPWDTKDFDTGGFWNVANPERFTITTPGVYLVTACGGFAANATGQRLFGFFKNGSAAILYGVANFPGSATVAGSASTSFLFNLVATDFIQFVAFQSSGGNLNFLSNFSSFFGICTAP